MGSTFVVCPAFELVRNEEVLVFRRHKMVLAVALPGKALALGDLSLLAGDALADLISLTLTGCQLSVFATNMVEETDIGTQVTEFSTPLHSSKIAFRKEPLLEYFKDPSRAVEEMTKVVDQSRFRTRRSFPVVWGPLR